jgi:serine/threonine protein kinase
MSPEIVESSEYSYSSDIWSIGVIFYCLFTMNHKDINFRLNFDKKKISIQKNIEMMNYQFGKEYEALIVECLDSDCEKRKTAEEILNELYFLKSCLNLNKKRRRVWFIKTREKDSQEENEEFEFEHVEEQGLNDSFRI